MMQEWQKCHSKGSVTVRKGRFLVATKMCLVEAIQDGVNTVRSQCVNNASSDYEDARLEKIVIKITRCSAITERPCCRVH